VFFALYYSVCTCLYWHSGVVLDLDRLVCLSCWILHFRFWASSYLCFGRGFVGFLKDHSIAQGLGFGIRFCFGKSHTLSTVYFSGVLGVLIIIIILAVEGGGGDSGEGNSNRKAGGRNQKDGACGPVIVITVCVSSLPVAGPRPHVPIIHVVHQASPSLAAAAACYGSNWNITSLCAQGGCGFTC
jgi:hypothetical protein